MKSMYIWIMVLIIVLLGGWLIYRKGNSPAVTTTPPTATEQETASNLPVLGIPATSDDIVVTSPAPSASITSPLQVSGKARGTWFFEASAPVTVLDLNGAILGKGTIQAQGDWTTSDLVPFTGTINFSTTTNTSSGAAILFQNDNPSGQASTSKYFALPVLLIQ